MMRYKQLLDDTMILEGWHLELLVLYVYIAGNQLGVWQLAEPLQITFLDVCLTQN
jgi:hypothetical protein